MIIGLLTVPAMANVYTYTLTGYCKASIHPQHAAEVIWNAKSEVEDSILEEYRVTVRDIVMDILNRKAYFFKSSLEEDIIKALGNKVDIPIEEFKVVVY